MHFSSLPHSTFAFDSLLDNLRSGSSGLHDIPLVTEYVSTRDENNHKHYIRNDLTKLWLLKYASNFKNFYLFRRSLSQWYLSFLIWSSRNTLYPLFRCSPHAIHCLRKPCIPNCKCQGLSNIVECIDCNRNSPQHFDMTQGPNYFAYHTFW